ncbi:MAG: rhodanese-like domain-containing protein [Aliivibrio sp.]|uniref:rhodanese-like domain-containing protein n=1 Tax=Aliivibrio sp. TaxID=1872443 RepID=UPI001A5D5251|nr:rhodanese-like domain-containing protein [Aliivibrio sp.]
MQEYLDFLIAKPILSLAWVGIFVILILTIIKQKTSGYTEVSPSELTMLMNREEATVLDIRSMDEYRGGHITGSRHILPSEIKDGKLGALENKKSTPIVVVCKTGQTAQANATLLHKAGFESVKLLKSGLISWNEANLPLVRGKK